MSRAEMMTEREALRMRELRLAAMEIVTIIHNGRCFTERDCQITLQFAAEEVRRLYEASSLDEAMLREDGVVRLAS